MVVNGLSRIVGDGYGWKKVFLFIFAVRPFVDDISNRGQRPSAPTIQSSVEPSLFSYLEVS